jgi:hypothetical protein
MSVYILLRKKENKKTAYISGKNYIYLYYEVSAGGIEPPTLCLKGRCSTTELRALKNKTVNIGRLKN